MTDPPFTLNLSDPSKETAESGPFTRHDVEIGREKMDERFSCAFKDFHATIMGEFIERVAARLGIEPRN